jgi:hypothetical protein
LVTEKKFSNQKKIDMKKIYLGVFLSSLFFDLSAQTFDWAKREGKYAYDYGYGIGTDLSGNVYVAGKYEEDGALFSGTAVPCAGNHDMFLAKYTSAGSLVWIRTAGGVLGDYAHAMAMDRTNYIYVAGELEGAGDVVNFSNSTTSLTTMGDNDIFVAKYDLNGNVIWAKSAGGSGGEKALGVSYDAAGNVYICGNYKRTFTYEGTTITAAVDGERDIFVAKYNSSGAFQWVRTASSPGRDEALSIQATPAGEVYVTGMYSDGATFGSTTLTTPNTPTGHYMNIYLAKYATDGTLQWVKSAGSDYDDVGWDITLDASGKVFLSGEFNAYATFDSHALVTTGAADIFVACYDAAGNAQWAKKAGGALVDRARGIGTDGTNIYITGQFGSTAAFGTLTATAVDSSDIFMAGLDNSGNFLWVKSVGGVADSVEFLGYESGNAIWAEGPNTVYATGALLDGGDFGTISLDDIERTDAFITKMTVVVGVEEHSNASSIKVYPNPADGIFQLDMSKIKGQKAVVNIYNYLGGLITQDQYTSGIHNVDVTSFEKGMYLIEIIDGNNSYREKIILQ